MPERHLHENIEAIVWEVTKYQKDFYERIKNLESSQHCHVITEGSS